MTKDEVEQYLDRPVRITLDDRQVYAGVLERNQGGTQEYIIRNQGPTKEQQAVGIDNAGRIVEILDASDDPAAQLNNG